MNEHQTHDKQIGEISNYVEFLIGIVVELQRHNKLDAALVSAEATLLDSLIAKLRAKDEELVATND